MWQLFKNFLTRIDENVLRQICSDKRARGSCENSLKIVVEATEGCSINQGKYAKRVKSTKFENQFCRLASQHLKFSKTCKNFSKACIGKITECSKTSLTCLEIFMQNSKVGEGDVFSKKTSLLP
jgi:uncharacterized membrane protein